jgi:hypothetical protein
VDRFLVQLWGAKRAHILAGKGKGIVKKIAIDYLKKTGYPWEYEKLANGKRNEGSLILLLD